MILAIRTDQVMAELYLLDNQQEQDRATWQAHRALSDTLLEKIDKLLKRNNISKQQLRGVVVFKGPGSFTGLRIGVTVANTLAYSLGIPVVGTNGEHWLKDGYTRLAKTKSAVFITPDYGGGAHITKRRK